MPILIDPAQPRNIIDARAAIQAELLQSGAGSQAIPGLIRTWQFEIRSWQDKDSLDTAFVEGRLTYRTMSNVGRHYNYQTSDATQNKVLGTINNDNYQKPLLADAVKNPSNVGGYELGAKRAENVEVLLNIGGAGIKRRLDPSNFEKLGNPRVSNKFAMGLHDISAHLLDPRGYKLKSYVGTTLVVLVPLPLPQDVSLFYELRKLGKVRGSPAFKSAMEVVACQFIRPRLASSLDMGATYVYKPATPTSAQSVKYVKAPSGASSQESPEQCRLNVQTNYRDILVDNNTGANEITLAVRKFGNNNRFPTFAIGQKGSTKIREIDIALVAPNTGNFSTYQESGWVIDATDFSRAKG